MTTRTLTFWTWFAIAATGGACSSGGSSPDGGGGSGGPGAAGSSGGGTTGTGGSGTAGTTGKGGTGGGTFLNAGACGERGMATANATTYDGTAEFYIISEAGLGVDVCVVRFDVKRTGAAPAGCVDPTTNAACNWSDLVTFSNPTVVTNTGGACDASDSVPPLDAAGIATINGMSIGRGFSRVAAHGDSLMKYDASKWDVVGRASWDEATGSLGYNIVTGACNYGH
jgi:hypothetical protein